MMSEETADAMADDEFGIVRGGSGMEGLEEGEPDDVDETQYVVGCEFDGELVMMAGHHDGRLSLLSLTPAGARFKSHLGPGGHTATVRDMVLLANGDFMTCAEDTSLCLWGHPRLAEEDDGVGMAEATQKPVRSVLIGVANAMAVDTTNSTNTCCLIPLIDGLLFNPWLTVLLGMEAKVPVHRSRCEPLRIRSPHHI